MTPVCVETCTCDPVLCDDLFNDQDVCNPSCAVCVNGCPLGDDCPINVPWDDTFAAHRPPGRTTP